MATCEKTAQVKTPAEAKQWFLDHGISITQWAQQHGFPRNVVYAALSGRTKGYRGESHEVALALQLKLAPANDVSDSQQQAPLDFQKTCSETQPQDDYQVLSQKGNGMNFS